MEYDDFGYEGNPYSYDNIAPMSDPYFQASLPYGMQINNDYGR